MSFGVQGFDELQKQLNDASEAFKALDGEIAILQFSPNDQSSVEAAIADMERAIDSKIGSYSGNPLVGNVVEQMKAQYRARILERASEAKEKSLSSANDRSVDQNLFRQIENTVTDLRQADSNVFARHIGKLSRLLHEPSVESISQDLQNAVDADAILAAGNATQGGMVGSARLLWPTKLREELGFVITMIDRFASDEADREGWTFAHTFFYNGSNSITSMLQHMVAQMIVPFARDYIGYVRAQTGASEATMLPPRSEPAARKAFIVHGHDDGSREAVARFLERINFEAIILHEKANQGQTIIEKIERHGDVGFAIVLLTPDDEGCVKGGSPRLRARQNVILELGYFIGRLTRSRVCALRRGDVEIPSDFGGVVYTPYDENGGWRTALGRELEAAGFAIDWNLVHKS